MQHQYKTEKINKDNAIGGVLALLVTGAGQSLIQIIILAIFARLVTPTAFGIIAVTLAVGDVMRVFARLGITQSLVQKSDINQDDISVSFTLAVLFSLLSGIALYLLSNNFAAWLNVPELDAILQILAIVFPITSISLVSEALLSRSLSFKTIALARLWAYIFGYAVLGLTLGYLGYGYWALVYAYIAQQILLSVYFFLKKPYRLAFSLKQDTLKSILRFGFGYSLSQLFTILALRADSFVISRTLGPISLGIYDRSYQLMRFPAFLLATIIDDALFPIFSRFQNDEVKMQSAFNKGLGVLAIVLFPLTIVLIVFAEHIIQVLLGSQWTDATLVFQILCISMYFRSAQRVATATLRAKGAVFISAFAQFVYALMIVVSAYWGSSWGIIGIAIGVALSIVINFILVSICAMKIIQMDNWKLFNPIFKSLPMTMVVGVISCIISIISSKIELNSFVTLLLVAVIAGLFSFIIFKYKPSLLLSQYGNWLMKIVTNKLEKKTRK